MKQRIRMALVAGVLGASLALAGCSAGESDRGLPKGMPETVSVGDGTISNAVTAKDSWSFVLAVADTAAQDSAVTTMKSNGYSEVGTSTSATARTYSLRNKKDGTNATLVLTKRDGKPVVVFNVVSTAR